MPTTEVVYYVPVFVEVDDESGEVLRVQVDDEAAELAWSEDPNAPAVKAAENGIWPAWEFGF